MMHMWSSEAADRMIDDAMVKRTNDLHNTTHKTKD